MSSRSHATTNTLGPATTTSPDRNREPVRFQTVEPKPDEGYSTGAGTYGDSPLNPLSVVGHNGTGAEPPAEGTHGAGAPLGASLLLVVQILRQVIIGEIVSSSHVLYILDHVHAVTGETGGAPSVRSIGAQEAYDGS